MRGAPRKVTRRRLLAPVIASLLLVVPTWAASGAPAGSVGALRAPRQATGAILPQVAVTIDLCASQGTATLPGPTSVPIWGFSLNTGSGCAPATLPGPVLDVPVGTPVTVNLTNVDVPENVSVLFYGQALPPDTTGVATGGSTSYAFTANDPGTFLYQAGTNVIRQVPMGLYGALVVRPTTGAYGTGTEFDVEKVLVLSEVDVQLNANPTTFNMLNYKPEFWLINGEAYPDTDPISATANQRVLLRYVNAGLEHHTMTLLGTHQRFIAKDGYPANFPADLVSETIPAGSTADAIATVPAGASGAEFALYNRQLHLDNAGTSPGGMLTFIVVA